MPGGPEPSGSPGPLARPGAVHVDGAEVHLTPTEYDLLRVLVRDASERYRVDDVSIEEPDLESIIRRIYVQGYQEAAL